MPEKNTQVKAAQPLYFVNAPVDFLMIGGLSLIVFLILFPLRGAEKSLHAVYLAAFLLWVGNWPHFAATNWRLYHAKENLRQYPLTAFVVPLLLLGAVAASFISPKDIAPYFVKLYLFWSPYHFSGQTMGLSLIYARRAGMVIGKAERYALSGFVFGSFILQNALAEVGNNTRTFYNISYPSLGLPPIVGTIALTVMWGSGAAFLIFIIRWSLKSKRMVPPIVLLPAVTQFFWFILGSSNMTYYEFVPFFHGAQYLLIAWAMQLKERMDMKGFAPSPVFVIRETAFWYAGIVVLGALLFWWAPRLGTRFGFPLGFAEPIIISAIQIHHFFVDGVIWKLRNPKVGSPLLVNVGQLMRKPALAAAPIGRAS